MEVDGVTRNIRNAGTPIRTWNRRRRTYCTIGNTEAPPDNPQITLRFYEECGKGLPLPHTLGDCRIRVVNNYGLCKSTGTIANGWSSYAEVLDVRILSENRGRRSSYDGADDAIVDEITAELLNIYDISTISFSQVNLANAVCAVGSGGVFDHASFGCFNGCGGNSCNCPEPCDDGTYTFYIPASCPGSTTSQFVISTNDGGENVEARLLPATTAGGTAAIYPKSAVIGNTLYVLAYQNPTELYSIGLDENGDLDGDWQLVATLTFGPGDSGEPGMLIADEDTLHILVNDDVNGSRYYTLGGNRVPTEGARYTFPAAAMIDEMAACGDVIVGVGAGGSIYASQDGGSSFDVIPAPSDWGGVEVQSVNYVDGRIWIGGAGGRTYYSANFGDTWTRISVPTVTGNVTSIPFAGDDVGWVIDSSGRPTSTWIGGLNNEEWTRDVQRVNNWPTTVTAQFATVPQCASSVLSANTVLVIGTDAGGNSVAYVGRADVTGV